MILERILCCECNPGKVFKNNNTYNAHLKSKRHINWSSQNDMKNLKKNHKDNENNTLSYKLKLNNIENEYNKLKIINEKNKSFILYYLKNFSLIIILLIIKYST